MLKSKAKVGAKKHSTKAARKAPAKKTETHKPKEPAHARLVAEKLTASASKKPDGNGRLQPKLHAETPVISLPDQPALPAIKSQSGVDLTEKIKELIRLAQEQGYLTYGDIN